MLLIINKRGYNLLVEKKTLYKWDPIKCNLDSMLKTPLTINGYTILEWSNYKCNVTNKRLNITIYATCNN